MKRLLSLLPLAFCVACGDDSAPREADSEPQSFVIEDGVHLFAQPHEVNYPDEVLPSALLAALAGDEVLVRGESQTEKRWGLVKDSAPPAGKVHVRAPLRHPFRGEARVVARGMADQVTQGDAVEEGTLPGPDQILIGPRGVEVVQPSDDPWPSIIRYAYRADATAVLASLCGGMPRPDQAPFRIEFHDGSRPVRFAPVPASLVWDVQVPPDGQLLFGYGLKELIFRVKADGGLVLGKGGGQRADAAACEVTFRVVVDDGRPQEVWSRTVAGDQPDSILDGVADLSPWAGQQVELRLETEGSADGQRFLPFWGEPLLDGRRAQDEERPNVVVILLDTLRADRLGCYGGERAGLTPHLDALARRGVRFDDTMSGGPCTLPSHATLFSSLYPSEHGVFFREKLPEQIVTVAEVLREGGYSTHAQTEGIFVHHEFGLAQGFDTFTIDPRGVRTTFAPAMQRIRGLRGPFFLFLHTYEVHIPYAPPAAYREKWVRPYDGPFTNATKGSELKNNGFVPGDVQYLRDLYDAEIAHADHWVGRFVGFLEEEGLMDDTLLVVTSDHGDEFNEHGDFNHGRSLYQEQLRVPLIVYQKGVFEGGQVARHTVHGVDLAPTLTRAAGIETPEVWRGAPLSVEPPQTDRPLFTPFYTLVHGNRTAAWRVGDLKLITFREEPGELDPMLETELYDLKLDPGEQVDLWDPAADPERAAKWLERLEDRWADHPPLMEVEGVQATHEDAIQGMGYAGGQ